MDQQSTVFVDHCVQITSWITRTIPSGPSTHQAVRDFYFALCIYISTKGRLALQMVVAEDGHFSFAGKQQKGAADAAPKNGRCQVGSGVASDRENWRPVWSMA